MRTVLDSKPVGATHWSVRSAAAASGLSKSTVARMLTLFNVKPHLVVDNYAAHKHPKVRAWLAERPRFTLHFTPTYASWMNLRATCGRTFMLRNSFTKSVTANVLAPSAQPRPAPPGQALPHQACMRGQY